MARPRQVSDEEILLAARGCFLEQGPSVSTTVIARRLGVSQAALFKRFGTKEDLLIAALAPPEIPGFVPLADAGPDARPLPLQLRELAGEIHRFLQGLVPCLAMLQASGLDMRTLMTRYQIPPPLRAHRALTGWFERAAAAGRLGPCEPSAVATILIGALQGHRMLSMIGATPNPAEGYLDQVVGTLWRGIAPEGAA